MQCVKTVRYSVKLNGEYLDPFTPSRGLRQGDPLSPYLFLFVADSLVLLMHDKINTRELSPIKIARNSPGVSNLLFADDSLLFFKATTDQAKVVKEILCSFQRGTGQLLSSKKCSLLFNENCPSATCEEIKDILGVESSSFESKYLGFPTPEERMKDGHFQPIMDKLH